MKYFTINIWANEKSNIVVKQHYQLKMHSLVFSRPFLLKSRLVDNLRASKLSGKMTW